ncbi:PAS domain S-box protein [Dactylosporangium sp. AC04546]|uniref:PAS domain S-box protein n=1 Tax=Dactylosporangium sp. AC04546 TaxID=2862460 RepID=UPI001EDDEEF6|nr:PAS domain S-box protein [Dactylosporangium sp. AC04546]WVK89666.1 PAS domain S-box protein [Dactylosporangium sp. AC04546]
MPGQLYLVGNLLIMVAYAAITLAIVVPVWRAGQLRTNKLAVATALIFCSCAVGHGMHAAAVYGDILAGHAGHVSWSMAGWDLLTAGIGGYYWTLRRSYGVLLGRGAIYVSPWEQRRLAEAGERERSARATLAAVVDATTDAVIGVSLDGAITAWNRGAERLFGYTADEVLGRPAALLADDGDEGQQAGVIARIAAGARDLEYEARRVRKDGTVLEVAVSLAPIEDATGALVGMAAVARDITAAKEATARRRAVEERTHQAQRMESLGKLAGGVAHDFNNILAIIANYTDFASEAVEALEREPAADAVGPKGAAVGGAGAAGGAGAGVGGSGRAGRGAAVQADLEQVRVATRRAMNLTRQLLTFTRADAVQPQDVDLDSVLAEVQAMLSRTIGGHINLVTVPAGEPLVVHADPGQLQQVLLNLAINARDAMPDGGTLVMEAGAATLDGDVADVRPELAAGEYARLAVSDTGEGMPKEVAERIFEPFFTTKPRGQGTGLGLATVYGIVAEAGGGIHVYTEPQIGTTFRVYLPRVRTAVAAGPAVVVAAPPDGGGLRVLVVEDEPALAQVVRRILVAGGYQVRVAADGAEALRLHEQHGCDLLLTDVIMPELSGPRLAAALQERQPGLPVLYMSGYSNGLLGGTQIVEPGVTLLEKPFTGTELLHKVHQVGAGMV